MKKPINLLLTDTHLSEKTSSINMDIWQQAVITCVENEIKVIYHLGDIFDSRKAQTQEILMFFQRILEMLEEYEIELIVIPGNHDKTSYQSSNSFLHVFKHHPGVRVVNESHSIHVSKDVIHHFVPFFDEKSGKYAEILKGVVTDPKKKNILFTHIGVNEAVMNGGSVIEDLIDGGIFDRFEIVYVGHFHDYQVLRSGKIVYIGSAYQSNFGENDKKGFQFLYEDGSIEFVQADFPRFEKVVIDINTATREEILALKVANENSEDNIRFVFKGDKSKLAAIDKNEFKSIGIDVKTEEHDAKVIDYSEMEVSTFNNESIKKEWTGFTKDDIENQKVGNEYFEKSLN